LDALHFQGLKAFTDDQFGTAAADVNDQAAVFMPRYTLRDTQVNEPGFFPPGNDIDTATERRFRDHQDGIGIFHATKRLGTDGPQIVYRDSSQPLAETREASKSTVLDNRVQLTLFIQAAAQPDHFLYPVDNPQFPVLTAGYQHVKAVAAKINGREGIDAF
jgi:hypothetical protein